MHLSSKNTSPIGGNNIDALINNKQKKLLLFSLKKKRTTIATLFLTEMDRRSRVCLQEYKLCRIMRKKNAPNSPDSLVLLSLLVRSSMHTVVHYSLTAIINLDYSLYRFVTIIQDVSLLL